MRKFTRVLCLCLMLALVFSLGMPAAFAEGTEPEPEAVEPTPTPAPEVPEPTSTPAPEVPDPETPSPYGEPKIPCSHILTERVVDVKGNCVTEQIVHYECICGQNKGTPISEGKQPWNHVGGTYVVNELRDFNIDLMHAVYCNSCHAYLGSDWHSLVQVEEKPATCLEDGHSAGKYCSAGCGYDTRIVYSAPGEHSWGEWTVKTPATCTEDGLEIRECSKCPATEERAIKAAGEHSWGEWTVKTPATCTKDGLEIRKCSKCTATEERTIAAEGHKPVAISDRAPTCTEPGSVGGKRCSVCKAVLEEPELVPATGHDWGLWADTKDGWRHVRFCANDPAHKQYEFHKMGNWITVKYNTETTDGYRERWCQAPDCDYHEVQVIRAGSPKTGDSSNILFYSGLCLASLCAASGLIVFAKRRKEQ